MFKTEYFQKRCIQICPQKCQNVFWFLSAKSDSLDLYWKIKGMLLKEVCTCFTSPAVRAVVEDRAGSSQGGTSRVK